MIGNLSYEEMFRLSKSLEKSSSVIKEVLTHYNSEKLSRIYDFCDSVAAYSRFIETYVKLYQDSDEALKFMIEKNK